VLIVTKADDGGYRADFYRIDQGGQPFPVTKITLDGSTLTFTIMPLDLKYEGKLRADGKTIEGSSTQGGNALPLNFARATPETEWAMPKPAPPLPPMAANANPSFDVATIKPSVPGREGKGFGFRAGHFVTLNTDLNDLIGFAYGQAHALLQIYFDRWQIEVNHREEKDTVGVGQAQLWNPVSVPKQPAFAVAAYSALLLAGLEAFGPARGPAFAQLPKWRRKAERPSCLDLVTLLRQQMAEHPEMLAPFGLNTSHQALTAAAAA
jgi:hypothetical protein